jgi:phosphoglycerate dehydrogenase-like enzyme
MATRPAALFAMREDVLVSTYGEEERASIAALTTSVASPQTGDTVAAHPAILGDVEVLITGWGGPRLDRTLLDHAPRLRAVFHGAGSVAPIMTPEAWQRGLIVVSAIEANAIPVAEYTVSMLLLALKGVFRFANEMRATRTMPRVHGTTGADALNGANGFLGAYRRCVGIVSLGAVGRAVVERLKGVDVTILAYDPFVQAAEARRLGVTLAPLADLFERADVVTLHAPHLPETVNLVGADHLRAMKPGATFINTSRGELVDEEALIGVASQRSDLQVILDVTRTMPLPASSPLYTLPNVLLTPHIAGSCGTEMRRMGRVIVEELTRYIAGVPLRCRVNPDTARHSSHETPDPVDPCATHETLRSR